MSISGAKFEEHCLNISRVILDWVLTVLVEPPMMSSLLSSAYYKSVNISLMKKDTPTSETISDSAEYYAGRFESSAACMTCNLLVQGSPITYNYCLWIMCILCTPRPTYRSTFRPTVNRRIGRHISRVSTDMSVDISVECQSIYWLRCVARYIGRHISRASVDMSTDTPLICRSICWPRVVVRLLAGMSIDRLPTFRRYFTATCVLVTGILVTVDIT